MVNPQHKCYKWHEKLCVWHAADQGGAGNAVSDRARSRKHSDRLSRECKERGKEQSNRSKRRRGSKWHSWKVRDLPCGTLTKKVGLNWPNNYSFRLGFRRLLFPLQLHASYVTCKSLSFCSTFVQRCSSIGEYYLVNCKTLVMLNRAVHVLR